MKQFDPDHADPGRDHPKRVRFMGVATRILESGLGAMKRERGHFRWHVGNLVLGCQTQVVLHQKTINSKTYC